MVTPSFAFALASRAAHSASVRCPDPVPSLPASICIDPLWRVTLPSGFMIAVSGRLFSEPSEEETVMPPEEEYDGAGTEEEPLSPSMGYATPSPI